MTSGSGDRAEESYRVEYPIGMAGETLRTVSGVLVGLLIGICLIVGTSSGEVTSMYDKLARLGTVAADHQALGRSAVGRQRGRGGPRDGSRDPSRRDAPRWPAGRTARGAR